MAYEYFIRLRVQLNSSGGLPKAQFRELIGKCRGCKRFMTTYGKDQHQCLGTNVFPMLAAEERLFFLLDSTVGGPGLTGVQLQHLFVSCPHCDLIFTRPAARQHAHPNSDHNSANDSDSDSA